MLESEAIERIRVENDATQPDWRFRLLLENTVVGEGFFDADSGWDVGDRPRGWTVRYLEEGVPEEFCREEPIRPSGKVLTWAARDAAAAAATEMVAAVRRQRATGATAPALGVETAAALSAEASAASAGHKREISPDLVVMVRTLERGGKSELVVSAAARSV